MKKLSITTTFPQFNRVDPHTINQELEQLLDQHRTALATLLDISEPSWENFIAPLQQINNQLDLFWAPIEHLHAVSDHPDLRQAYQSAQQTLTTYLTTLAQNTALYQQYHTIANHDDFQHLTDAQRKAIHNALRDFHLAGVDLPSKEKQTFCALEQRLADLTTQFENHVLDATQAWYYHMTDARQLTGIPEHACDSAAETAKKKGLSGWVFTLDLPSYLAVMRFADDRTLREQCYHAYVTRASDQGPHAGKWDNHALMQEILQCRHEKASLLGFNTYTELSLATKMADNPTDVFAFLDDLLQKTKPFAEKEFLQLQTFAAEHCHLTHIEAWDVSYVAEKMQQQQFHISQQQLRPYFPKQQVIQGLFTITQRLFGIECHPVDNLDRWDPDVEVYAVYDAKEQLCGHFYFDLYARENKRGGAWVNDGVPRALLLDNVRQTPIAFVNCNFAPPTEKTPCLLTHDDVITLFHEFGHCLHHILTKVDVPDVSGINGVAWDAVELPSQFLENWCWHRESLSLFAKHYTTKAPLPDELFDKLKELKHFQAAMGLMRQLEFALFDFHVHHDFVDPADTQFIQQTLDQVRQRTQITPVPDYNRFPQSFSHIFAGGYAAGYYSYLWAEVLSTDAFARFLESSLFNKTASHDFLHAILEQGGSKDMLACFIEFRGREPQPDALLKEYGLIS